MSEENTGASGAGAEGAGSQEGQVRQFGSGSGSSEGTGSQGGQETHWNSYISDESIRSSNLITQMGNVKTPQEAINSLATQAVNAEKALGSKRVEMPQDNWTPEKLKQWNQEVRGVPEKVDGYKLEGVDTKGMDIGADVQGAYVESFHNLDLTDQQVTGVLNTYYDRVSQEQVAHNDAVKASVDANTKAMQVEWGEAYDLNLDIAEKGLEQYAGDDLLKVLQANPDIMSMPAIQKIFYTLGSLEVDDAIRGQNFTTLDGANRMQSIQNEIQNIESSDLWIKRLGNKLSHQEKPQADELNRRRAELSKELHNLKLKHQR